MQTRLLGCGSRRKWAACAVGAVVVAVVMGGVFSLFANSTTALGDAAYSDSEKEAMDLRSECVYPFKTNELGMTYGTLDDAPDGQEPDLILARATNGRSGFISKKEWDEASAADAPAGELRTAQAELESAAAKMLKDEIDEDLQGAEISLEGAAGIIDAMHVGDAPEIDYDAIAEEAARHVEPLEGELTQQDTTLTAEIVEDAYLDVVEATTVYIPVYDVDGRTVIGEFPVTQI
ncbi:hypothetical protein [Adlercreutzia caecimuris]|jgi:hypothetical protein|uniref:hypothetical protein n=1 Tax=Adlercreutzia caecimuris TaxID=671266 RepID=UPI002570A87B|nr:hypothetical protein [Adlercreutzia caecimuris]